MRGIAVQGQHAETAKLVLPSYDNASSTAAQSAASKIHVWLPQRGGVSGDADPAPRTITSRLIPRRIR